MPRQLKACGSRAAYVRHQRHGEDPCDACVQGNRLDLQQARSRRQQLPPDQIPHGRNGYIKYGCRCETCTQAKSQRCLEDRRKRTAREAAA